MVPITLVVTDITDEGTFEGATEFSDLTPNGTYGGTFGGDGATAVAGVVHTTDFDEVLENEEEYGVFVLERCGTAASTSSICDSASP